MKKIFLTMVASAAVLTASATVESTTFYSEDFIEQGLKGDVPTDGWLTKGNGAKPTGEYPTAFFNPDGEGPYYMLIDAGDQCYAMANTFFEGNVAANEWLISPEIEIPYDGAVVSFTAAAYCGQGAMAYGKCNFNVCVSEGGTEEADFSTVICENSVTSSTTKEIVTKTLNVPMTGFGGKKVRLGFQITGTNVGFIGFTNISIAQYALDFTNMTAKFFKVGDPIKISVNPGLRTPVACPGFDLELAINGKQVASESVDRDVYGKVTTTTLMRKDVTFSDLGNVEEPKSIPYTITLTPRFEGAKPSVLEGSVNVIEKQYVSNVVMEEGTSVNCQFCPIGSGSIEYYHEWVSDQQKEGATGKFIPIAVHGGTYEDPMEEGVRDYAIKLAALNNNPGYPMAMFNRSGANMMPYNVSNFQKAYVAESLNDAKILSVEVPELAEGEYPEGKIVKVVFEVRNGYSTTAQPLSAAVVLLENGVKGINSSYNQTNAFANYDASFINNYNPVLVPYMKKYLNGGELGINPIPFTDITYDHVARGIYPSFYGQTLTSVWTTDEPQTFELTFAVPKTVTNLDTTDVVLLVIEDETTAVMASDIMSATDYKVTSGVEEIAADAAAIAVAAKGGMLSISGVESVAVVEVYAADGTRVASYTVNGSLETAAPCKGLAVVKVSSNGVAKIAKVIF